MKKNKMKKFTDKYFLRANEILKKEGLNPWVNMQVFVRKGPGKIAGIDEAVNIILENSNIKKVGGRIYAKQEGSNYNSKDTVMNIIAPIQEIIELETVYLGVIAKATTLHNDKKNINLEQITKNVREIVRLANRRDVLYFGARHWHYEDDKKIAKAAYEGGIRSFATDNGAEQFGLKGLGTIPHALENVYAYYYGRENGTAKSVEAFDKHMPKSIPRIALVDYNNEEITDSIASVNILRDKENPFITRLSGVRIDTCGENYGEKSKFTKTGKKYWQGKGVTTELAYNVRKALDNAGTENRVKIILSSGFSNPEKVKAFNEAEEKYGVKLYDCIGAGFLDGVRTPTADVILVGKRADDVDFYVNNEAIQTNSVHKVGRPAIPNYDLERII